MKTVTIVMVGHSLRGAAMWFARADNIAVVRVRRGATFDARVSCRRRIYWIASLERAGPMPTISIRLKLSNEDPMKSAAVANVRIAMRIEGYHPATKSALRRGRNALRVEYAYHRVPDPP